MKPEKSRRQLRYIATLWIAVLASALGALAQDPTSPEAPPASPEPLPSPSASPLAATETETPPPGAFGSGVLSYQRHVLRGHNFLPTTSVPDPFVDTQTSLLVGGAIGSYPNPGLGQAIGAALGQDLKIGGFEVAFDLQYALIPRLAISLGLSGNVVTGLNTNTMLIYGASVNRQWNAGLLGSLVETPEMQLSLGINAQIPHYLAITPLDLVAQLNRNAGVALPDFNSTNVAVTWLPSLRFAYAFDPAFGILAQLGGKAYQFDQSLPNQSGGNLTLGVGGSWDFKPVWGVPIGLTANYFRNQIVVSNSVNSNAFSFGLYETRWTQVAFGAEIGFGNLVGQDNLIGDLNVRVYY